MQTRTQTLAVGTKIVLTAASADEFNCDGSVHCTHATRGDSGIVLADYGEGCAVVRWDRSGGACDVDHSDLVVVGRF